MNYRISYDQCIGASRPMRGLVIICTTHGFTIRYNNLNERFHQIKSTIGDPDCWSCGSHWTHTMYQVSPEWKVILTEGFFAQPVSVFSFWSSVYGLASNGLEFFSSGGFGIAWSSSLDGSLIVWFMEPSALFYVIFLGQFTCGIC